MARGILEMRPLHTVNYTGCCLSLTGESYCSLLLETSSNLRICLWKFKNKFVKELRVTAVWEDNSGPTLASRWQTWSVKLAKSSQTPEWLFSVITLLGSKYLKYCILFVFWLLQRFWSSRARVESKMWKRSKVTDQTATGQAGKFRARRSGQSKGSGVASAVACN